VDQQIVRKFKLEKRTADVQNVIGMSTSVRATASMKGWYSAALFCLRTIGRWANKAAISAMLESAEKRSALDAVQPTYRMNKMKMALTRT
jgi:hypothetical protein